MKKRCQYDINNILKIAAVIGTVAVLLIPSSVVFAYEQEPDPTSQLSMKKFISTDAHRAVSKDGKALAERESEHPRNDKLILDVPKGRTSMVTIEVEVDSYYSEASWQVYDYQISSYITARQYFTYAYEQQVMDLDLSNGQYAVDCFDSYGDGGICGCVTKGSSILVSWEPDDYEDYGYFDFLVSGLSGDAPYIYGIDTINTVDHDGDNYFESWAFRLDIDAYEGGTAENVYIDISDSEGYEWGPFGPYTFTGYTGADSVVLSDPHWTAEYYMLPNTYYVNFDFTAHNSHGSDTNSESVPIDSCIKGIDVAEYQGEINWYEVEDAGYTFAFVRSTIGNPPDIDDNYLDNMNGAYNADILVGPYHVAFPDTTHVNDAVIEAQFFVNTVQQYLVEGVFTPRLRPVLDIEQDGGLSRTELTAWVHTWMRTVENLTGIEPILYTYPSFATEHLAASVSTYDLWIAHYRCSIDIPPNTAYWDHYDFWQYYAPEPQNCGPNDPPIPGVEHGDFVDLDVFNGVLSELELNFAIDRSILHVGSGQPFSSIQSAINAAFDGDMVYVHPGTYYGSIVIDSSIYLIGENKATTTINGQSVGSVVNIRTNDVTVAGFTITGAGSNLYEYDAGVLIDDPAHMSRADSCYIADNIITGNYWYGIILLESSYNTITRNEIRNTLYGNGITLKGRYPYDITESNEISYNSIHNNYLAGIVLVHTRNNVIFENTIRDNRRGIFTAFWDGSPNGHGSRGSVIYHNNFKGATQEHAYGGGQDSWDNGYQVGGNYWQGHNSGPFYIPPDLVLQDHYPFYNENGWR